MNSIFTSSTIKKDLDDLSIYLGNNLDWVQGAGGNTSVKDNGVLWVKASGLWLIDAQNKNIFIPLKLDEVLHMISQGLDDLISARVSDKQYVDLRPSIEATLHALMPHRFVIHVHSVNVISHAILNNGKKILNDKLDGISWLWVPYVRPGIPLSRTLKKLNASKFDVLILANHGLVIGADTKNNVIKMLREVEKRLSRPIKKNFYFSDKKKLLNLTKNSAYKLPKYDFCHFLAMDSLSLELLIKNPLYPDHVIFLGPGPLTLVLIDNFDDNFLAKSFKLKKKVLVIKDFGVLIHRDLSENGEEILHCLTNVLLRCFPNKKINHLSSAHELELLGWDAEKYRKLIQR